jgi:dTDP-4-amino-4,6-dideoxygalactose transaminase
MNLPARVEHAPIPFIDVAAQRRRLGGRIEAAVARVLEHCQFILGPEVRAFEAALAEFCGARHAVSCASGTDALLMVLMANGIGPGDAVICPSFTFCATAEAVALLGATPVFADVNAATFNIAPASAERAVAAARRAGLRPRMIIPVDLFGLPADHAAIAALAAAEKLFVLDDAAQGFGGGIGGRQIGTFADATATSFFPAKPLGCYGDGGAVLTDDEALRDVLVSLRVHGHGADKYDNVRIGLTARLDTIQAAVLIEKLKIFPEEILARNRIAERYTRALTHAAIVPMVPGGLTSVWAQYTIRVAAGTRERFTAGLSADGVPTAIYYPKPLHRQTAYRRCPCADDGLPESDRIAAEVVSLPMHAYLDEATQDRIIAAALRAIEHAR